MAYNIDNKEFKNFFLERIKSNRNGIKNIRFNKKSISVTIDKDLIGFYFNNFFTEKSLFKEIIFYLSLYIKENNLNCFNTYGIVYDIDYLNYVFENGINVNYR